jgi:hypothetical protein
VTSADDPTGRPVSGAVPVPGKRASRHHATDREQRLPPYLVSGNRFASVGLASAIVGLWCSFTGSLQLMGWMSALAGTIAACVGFVKYCRGGATNRDAAVLAGIMAWLALVILLARVSMDLRIPVDGYPLS